MVSDASPADRTIATHLILPLLPVPVSIRPETFNVNAPLVVRAIQRITPLQQESVRYGLVHLWDIRSAPQHSGIKTIPGLRRPHQRRTCPKGNFIHPLKGVAHQRRRMFFNFPYALQEKGMYLSIRPLPSLDTTCHYISI